MNGDDDSDCDQRTGQRQDRCDADAARDEHERGRIADSVARQREVVAGTRDTQERSI